MYTELAVHAIAAMVHVCELELNSSCSQVWFADWDVDECNQQMLAARQRENQVLTWTSTMK